MLHDTHSFCAGLVSVVDFNQIKKLADFGSYAQRIGGANPTGIGKAGYSPTNTALQTCPSVNDKWAASSALPPTPNAELCECLSQASYCVVPDSLPEFKYGQ